MSRIRANQITNQSADGAPTVQNGLVISGVTTSTTFSGSGASLTNIPSAQLTGALPALDGSNLTGISAGTSLSGSTNNTVCTVTGANAIQGEANLTFDGDDLLIKSSTDGRRISFAGDGTSHYMKYDNTLGGIILNGYGGIAFETNGTNERLRITSGGYVGINTDVSGNGSGAKLVVGGRIQSNAGGYWFAGANGAEDGWHVQDSSGNLIVVESGVAERLRIDSSGRMMIGTTTEGYSSADDLTVSTSGTTGITIRSGTSNTGTLAFSDGTSGADEYRGYIQYEHQNDALAFGSNGTEKFRISSTGNVSINTTNVTEGVLQVNGDISAGILHGGRMYGLLAKRKFDGNNSLAGFAMEYASGYESPYIVAYNNTSSPSANNITFGSLTTSDRNLNTGLTKLVEINANSGNTTLKTGNLVIGTSGRGIDFSATSDTSGKTSELLDDYEEGSWTPAVQFDVGGSGITYGSRSGTYVKIGRMVHLQYYMYISGGVSSSDYFARLSLPFTGIGVQHQDARIRQYNNTISDWFVSLGGSGPVFYESNGLGNGASWARGDNINGAVLSGQYTLYVS